MANSENKRLLVISHNCFSKTGSNGRTLSNYLVGWDREKLAQLYIHSEQPDFSLCEKFFCITDSQVARSILKRKPAGTVVPDIPQEVIDQVKSEAPAKKPQKILKNSAVALVRELAWISGLWNGKKLYSWIDKFNPEVILFQAGDGAFLFRLVRKLAEKRNIPVVIYNTEGYYFKDISYMEETKLTRLLYPHLHKLFCREYKKLLKVTKHSIYNCDLLAEDYEKAFGEKGSVIMNTSEFTNQELCSEKANQIIYAGNLGLLRHRGLIEFAAEMKKVSPDMVLQVYGKAPTENVEKELNEADGISYNGLIPYEELKTKLEKSKYLLHVESFDDFIKEDLKYAFSTKIADSLACGSCLFVYAPENMAVCRYLQEKNASVLVTEKDKLAESIKEYFEDNEKTAEVSENGRALALKYHNIEINRKQFQAVINN